MTAITQIPPLVTIFGGSGFLGRAVVRVLARRGYRIRVAVRNPNLAHHLQPLGNVGQIHAVRANLRNRASIERAAHGADHVINMVGILHESGRQTFEAVQDFGARHVAEAAREMGAGLIHISAIGANPDSSSAYDRTKAQGEVAVLGTVRDAVVIRPSIMFGPSDDFFNRFAAMARMSPALPLIGGGLTKFQPVYVGDVAEAVARAVDGKVEGGRIYELGGPEVLTFRQCMEEMLKVIDRKRALIHVPWWAARMIGSLAGLLPNPVLTVDQVESLRYDNVVSERAIGEGRTFAGLAMAPQAMDAILPFYLWQYRESGQFARPTGV